MKLSAKGIFFIVLSIAFMFLAAIILPAFSNRYRPGGETSLFKVLAFSTLVLTLIGISYGVWLIQSERRGHFLSRNFPMIAWVVFLVSAVAFVVWFGRTNRKMVSPKVVGIYSVASAMNLYKMLCKKLPLENIGLSVILTNAENCESWDGPILKQIPLDFWGREIVYKIEGGKASLISYGSDGKLGGEGDDADIVVDLGLVEQGSEIHVAKAQAKEDFDAVIVGKPPVHVKHDKKTVYLLDGGSVIYQAEFYNVEVRKKLAKKNGQSGFMYGPIITFKENVPGGKIAEMSDLRFYTVKEMEQLLKEKSE